MELAAAFSAANSGSLILAAIASVFTIRYVANLLGEDEDWLHQLSIDMFPETAASGFTVSGKMAWPPLPRTALRICARSSPMNEPPAARHHRSNPLNDSPLRCSPHGHTNAQKFRVWISGQVRRLTAPIRHEMRRRAAVIGRIKAEHPGTGWAAIISKGSTATESSRPLAGGYNFGLLLRWLELLLRP